MRFLGIDGVKHLYDKVKNYVNEKTTYTLINGISYTSYMRDSFSTNIHMLGNSVVFMLDITYYLSSDKCKLGTIPAAARPVTSNIVQNVVDNNGNPCYIYIDPDGSFGVTYQTNKTGTFGVRYTISYIL